MLGWKGVLAIAMFCLCSSADAQEKDAFRKFRRGVFTYKDQLGDIEITRTRRWQIEEYNQGRSRIVFRVTWLNDSTYQLRCVRTFNAPCCLKRGDVITSVITSHDEDGYNCTYVTQGCGKGRIRFVRLE